MNTTFPVSAGRLTFRTPVYHIVYLKAEGNYCRVYLKGGKTGLLTANIGQVSSLLPCFWRCHKSYLVNPDHITHRPGSAFIRLSTGGWLPIARRRKKGVTRLIAQLIP